MNWKKPFALTMAGALLAGCSSGSGSTGGTTDTGTTVTVAFDADLNTMDPQVATDGNSFIMQSMGISGLTQLNEAGEAVADLAESWDISEDGLTYTFHLRDGITWSNGEPVTAADFVFGWQRLVDPDLASEYNFIMDTIGVANAAEVIAGELPLSDLGVEAVDDQTFVVNLNQPSGFLLGLMAFPSFFPVNEAFFNEKGDQFAQSIDDLLYCGPYTMTDWQTGNQYTFTKNENYWNADAVETDTVVFKFLQDTQSAMLEYQQGNIDVVKLASEQVDAYSEEEGFTTRLQGYAWRLDFNFFNEKLANKDLREAISKAIDRESIAVDVLKDGSVAAEGFIPKEFAYYNGEDYRDTAGNLLTEDVAEAQAAYERAKEALGGDVTLTLLFEDSEACKAVAENIQSQLQTNLPGITIELDSKPKKTRLDIMNNNEHEIGLTRWGPDYADPQTFLDIYKSNRSGFSASYSNEEYNAILDKAETGEDAADFDARWADMIEAEKILLEDYAIVPVYQNGGAMMINPAVSGIEFHNAGVDSYRYVKKAA